MSEATIQPRFGASEAVVEWCLRNALRMERHGQPDGAALWGYIAAGTASEFGHSCLCVSALESLLCRLGARIPADGPTPRENGGASARRWLHVFTATGPIGGHTAVARRWVAHNPLHEQHSVVLTVQPLAEVDPGLDAAVRRSGGSVHSLAGTASLLQRAAALRRLASAEADVVVVHAHTWDVMPTLAFAVAGGPPVLLLNHADHAFWVGTAVADIVLDIRDSGRALSTSLRGARGSFVLPVPLEDRGPAPAVRTLAAQRLRDPSLLERSPLLLTIGSPHKYVASGRLDFPQTILRIAEAIPACGLVAVGPQASDATWQRLAEHTGGRVIAVGPDADLAPWHAAADLYLESFPIGSYTALLEVGLAERAFVRKPLLAPVSALPVDRGALAGFEPPADPDAYVAAVIALAADPGSRTAQARAARDAVLAQHCGDGWGRRLEALQQALPRQHDVGLAFEPPPMPPSLAAYWAGIHAGKAQQSPLDYAQVRARENGLHARLDVAVLDAMRQWPH